MSSTKCVVSLLALAGSAFVFFNSIGHRRQAPSAQSIPTLRAAARNNPQGKPDKWTGRNAGATSLPIPVAFEPNVGQAVAPVQFIGQGEGLTMLFKSSEIEIAIATGGRDAGSNSTVRMRLIGAKFSWSGKEKLRGETNYFVGNDPHKWRSHVPHFAQVEAPSVARGVDMVVYGNSEGAEYDMRLAPGSDTSKLSFAMTGAQKMTLTESGDLLLRVGGRDLRMRRPEIYEELREGRTGKNQKRATKQHVEGGYRIDADGTVGFRIGQHDSRATLVVDPSLAVEYSTFLGGTASDSANSIALDTSGNVYIGGTTALATTFPGVGGIAIGPGVASGGGSWQFFIAKINPMVRGAGSLVYLTFLGGSTNQSGGLIAVDALGDVSLTGTTTSPDFPVTDGSQLTLGKNDVSVSEIDPTGSDLIFSTLFGGSGAESQYGSGGIALDASGSIFIASDTSSVDLPVTSGAFQTSLGGTTTDAFLAVFNPNSAPALTYCSYLGIQANAQMGVGGIAVDASGSAYVAGFTSDAGNTFPLKNAFQNSYGGDPSDAFLVKITPSGQGAADLVYATLLGGAGLDRALAVAVDSATPPNAYVTGTTQSKTFPTNGITAAYQASLHSGATANAFLSVVGQNGTSGKTYLAYSTYVGGSESDVGQGVVIGAPNEVYVTGTASSWDFPWKDNFQPFNGGADAFIAKFDLVMPGSTSLIYATPLGGTAPPGTTVSAAGNAIVTDRLGHVYVAGATTAADFPTAVSTSGIMNGLQPVCSSCQAMPPLSDGFVVEIQEYAAPASSVYFSLPRIAFPAMPLGTQNVPQLIAVRNGGEASLSISNLGITGTNSSDFSLIGQGACQGQTISPGGLCGMEIGFTPSIVGSETAVLSISDNAPGSPQVLELVGVGQGAFAQISPLSVSFGNVPVGSVPTTGQAITIANLGNQALTLASITESGPDLAQFPVNGKTFTCGTTLGAGQNCSVQAFFQPQTTGTFHAEMDILDNSGGVSNSKQIVTLTGTGTPPAPLATILPATLSFGSVAVSAATGTQVVTLTNQGSASLNLTSIGMTGSNLSDFAIVPTGSNPCPVKSGSIAAGGSCTVAVQFSPQTGGVKSANLSFADNASGSPQTVTLSGTAIAPPTIQVSPGGLNFLSQSVGIASASQSIALTNTSASSLSINGISITGANPADFLQSNNCPPVLGAGAMCVINIVFKPNIGVTASRTAVLTVIDNAPGSPQNISLTGFATQAGLSLTPASISFGGQLAGTSGAPVTLTVSDNGTGALAFTGIKTSGTNAGDFVIGANTCASANTSQGGTCTIQLSFSPACVNAPAARVATLVLTDNAPGSPQSVPLSGTPTGDFCFDPPVGATTATVKAGQTATYSLVIFSPGGYTGSVALSCAGAPPEGTCASSPGTVTLPAQFAVTVTTTAHSFLPPSGYEGARRQAPVGLRGIFLPGLTAFLTLVVFWMEARLRARRYSSPDFSAWTSFALIFVLALELVACSGGGGAGTSSSVDPGTPAQTYPISLTGTASDGTTRTLSLTLIVQ